VITHALLEKRVASGFADNQICPLDNNDGHEESRVAGVFKLFAGIVGL